MQLPSWVNPAPLAFGTSQHGLSADQWQTVATINLPVTLARTWGVEGGRRLEMVRNFLNLVDAIQCLGFYETDDKNLRRADMKLKAYLEGVKSLYEGAKSSQTTTCRSISPCSSPCLGRYTLGDPSPLSDSTTCCKH